MRARVAALSWMTVCARAPGRLWRPPMAWHRRGCLRAGRRFTWSWTRDGKPLGSIDVRTEADAVVLTFTGSHEWKSIEQRVPLVSTKCHLGGARPWFRCSASVGCGRRVAKLYLRGAAVFACRRCCGLVFASQSENPRYRAISRAQKIRMRLGASANLAEPLPGRPHGMHWRTYHRLLARAMAASIALAVDHLHRLSRPSPRLLSSTFENR
jgi:hypothetical protein